MNLNIIEARLRADNGLTDAFHFYRWECFPKRKDVLYYELEGCITTAVYKTGPRKGRPNFSKGTDERVFVVTPREVDAWEADYEKTTGKCAACAGEGREVARISVKDGTTYRPCGKCKGSCMAAAEAITGDAT